MKEHDHVIVKSGELKGYQGVITEVSSDPGGILCQLDKQWWVERWNLELVPDFTLKVKYFSKNCTLEQHGDWIDLKAAKGIQYKQGDFLMIPLGIAIKLPVGHEAHMLPRSSTFKRYGIIQTNSMGIIDEAYCGNDDQWFFPAIAMREGEIKEGDRIAQFRIVKKQPPLAIMEVEKLDSENRGGFGSTGQ